MNGNIKSKNKAKTKKSILFVILNLESGGTNSSLSCVYDNIKSTYDAHVLPLTNGDKSNRFTFSEVLVKSPLLLSLFFYKNTNSTGIGKYAIFIFKCFKYLCKLLKFDLEKCLFNYTIKSLFRNTIFDVCVAFQEGAPTRFASLVKSRKHVAWVHCDYSLSGLNGEEIFYDVYDEIVHVSKYTEKSFLNIYPQYINKSKVIYNLLDCNSILAKSNEYDPNIKKGIFTIISIGRLSPVKRYNLIPQMAKSIKDKGAHFQWIIVGGGNAENEANIKNEIIQFGVKDVVFMVGPKSNPYPYLKNADLLACLSSTEACPMIFNEAKILGIPILTTDFGSSNEFVFPKTGKVVSLSQYTDELFNLISDKTRIELMKANLLEEIFSDQKSIIAIKKVLC